MTITTPTLQRDHRAAFHAWLATPGGKAIYDAIERIALDHGEHNLKFGIALCVEIVRWQRRFEKVGSFKINNAHRAYIARKLLADHPHLTPYLRTAPVKW